MGPEFSGLMKRPWTTTPWKSFFVIHGIFNAIKRPWKATQNFHGVSMSIHGFAQNLRVFMAHENWKIKGFLMAFLMFFFFHAFSRVTCHEKSYKISHENTIKILWKSREFTMN